MSKRDCGEDEIRIVSSKIFGLSWMRFWHRRWRLFRSLIAQDWIKTGTGLGVEKVRLAAADFKACTADAKNATC